MQPNQLVAKHLRERAAWRRSIVEKYGDAKSIRCAHLLDKLASFVESLPADNATCRRLVELSVQPGRFLPPRGSQTDRWISTYGYGAVVVPTPEYTLWTWLSCLEDDALPVAA